MKNNRFKPAAFMSYDHSFDRDGRLSKLREILEREVKDYTAEETFSIFQDKPDIKWGEDWKERIKGSLNEVTFFLPVLTPSFFKSENCRFELKTFLDREKKLRRKDLVLPIYYIETPILEDETKRKKDELAIEIHNRQYADWRKIRNCPIESPEFSSRDGYIKVMELLDNLAVQIRDALSKTVILSHPNDLKAYEGSTITFNVEAIGEDLTFQWQQSRGENAAYNDIPGETNSYYTITPLTLNDNGKRYQVVVKGSKNSVTSESAVLNVIRNEKGSNEDHDSGPSKVLIVDPKHKSEINTITKAISRAKPEDKILVRPGIYDECIIIDKALDIIGDGEPGEIVIRTSGMSVVQVKASMGCFSNISLQQLSGGSWPCVDISQGRLELKECDITSHSSACIAIHGSAEPIIHDNVIHDGNDIGILVSRNSSGIIENNHIYGNALAGVEIRGGSNPKILHNKIYDNNGTGISISKDGLGTIEDNKIYGNALSGVEITSSGNPKVLRNEIHDGKGTGISVSKDGKGTIEENEIYGNVLAGVEIVEGGNPIIRRNKLRDGKDKGLVVFDNGIGLFEENEIFGHERAGVEITTGGNPTIRHNRIHDGKDCGILVSRNGEGVIEDNQIFMNTFPAVEIRDGGNPVLRRNLIYDGRDVGIFIHNNGKGLIEDNNIYNNNQAGVAISGKSNPSIRYNRIYDGKLSGILVYKSGEGIIEDNIISRNAHSGVEISEEGNPTLYRNRIEEGKDVGILVAKGGLGIVEGNDISGNAQAGVEIREFASPILKRNRINKNGYYGIYIHDNGGGTIVENDLRDNNQGPYDLDQSWRDPNPPHNRPKLIMSKNLE
jgi:F-box protein 11